MRRCTTTGRVPPDAARPGAPAVRLLGRGRVAAAVGARRRVRRAPPKRAGFDSLWLSDHLFLDIAKYGGPPDATGVSIRSSRSPRSRASVDARAPRHARAVRGAAPGVGARQGARQPRPSSATAGSTSASAPAGTSPSTRRSAWTMPRPGERLDAAARGGRGPARPARRRPVHVRRALPPRRRRGERSPPRCSSRRRRSSSAARATACSRSSPSVADGWNTCWVWTPDAYRERLEVLDRACDAIGRDPGVGHAVARPLRAVRRGRARPRAALRAAAGADPARRARRRHPRAVAGGPAGRDGRAGPGAGRRAGQASASRPDRGRSGRSRSP